MNLTCCLLVLSEIINNTRSLCPQAYDYYDKDFLHLELSRRFAYNLRQLLAVFCYVKLHICPQFYKPVQLEQVRPPLCKKLRETTVVGRPRYTVYRRFTNVGLGLSTNFIVSIV